MRFPQTLLVAVLLAVVAFGQSFKVGVAHNTEVGGKTKVMMDSARSAQSTPTRRRRTPTGCAAISATSAGRARTAAWATLTTPGVF
jgi:hypothetical protein